MGEVYRAKDTRLDRTVAIKVLPAHVAGDGERRQRFEREARAVSSLNHPHICTLHDIGRQDGIDYLVMEHLEGKTLTQSLAKGPLPLEQALRYGVQIADALDQAHRQGVFHRDLKPGNVMLIKSGAKLLDFGLAKLRLPEETSAAGLVTTLPARASTLTVEGTILGTLQYMAPEQLEGKDTDGRTDIFAFGAVLYEMLTGQRAFEGESAASLIAAILSSDPPELSRLRLTTGRPEGPALERVVRKCLAKNPDDRWQTARDLASEIQWIAEAGAPRGPVAGPVRPRNHAGLAWAVATLAVTVALLLGVAYFHRATSEAPTLRLFFSPPEKTSLAGSIAVSPDGKQLAFVTSTPDGSSSLWVRPLDSLDARMLPGTEGAVYPFWSPDSRFLGFFADGKLKKVRVEGGPPQSLSDVFYARGGTWGRGGMIVFSPNDRDPLYRIADTGGAPTLVTTLDPSRQESSHQWPYFLPDGRHFLYLVWSGQAGARGIYVGSLDSKETKRLLDADWGVAFGTGPGQTSYLLFLRGRTLMAQPFDIKALRLSGEPFPIAEHVWYDETKPGLTSFSVSENGVMAYRSGGIRTTQLIWFDRAGKPLGSVGQPGAYRDPCLSPDEKRVVVPRIDPQTGTLDVWLFESKRDVSSRLTFHPLNEGTPLWSPDGSQIVFASDRDGPPNLYRKASSGAADDEALLGSHESKYPTDWSRDGRYIVYSEFGPKKKWDLWILPTFGERKPFRYLESGFDAFQAKFSPDGRWIAYTSNESNRYEVYVQPFPMSAGRWQISTNGGAQPSWRRDGKELFYLAPDRKLIAVEVKAGSTFEPGVPKALFQTQVLGVTDARNHYAPSGDGQRFLVSTVLEESASSPITVVVGWTIGLKR